MNKNWLVRIYDLDGDKDQGEQINHVVVRDRAEHEAEHEVANDVRDAADWTMMEITPRDEVWLLILDKIVEGLRDAYNGSIEDYTVLDQGWDSLDVIELVMFIEEALWVQISDEFLDKVKLNDLTPVQVAQQAVDLLTDAQITQILAHEALPAGGNKPDLVINLVQQPVDPQPTPVVS